MWFDSEKARWMIHMSILTQQCSCQKTPGKQMVKVWVLPRRVWNVSSSHCYLSICAPCFTCLHPIFRCSGWKIPYSHDFPWVAKRFTESCTMGCVTRHRFIARPAQTSRHPLLAYFPPEPLYSQGFAPCSREVSRSPMFPRGGRGFSYPDLQALWANLPKTATSMCDKLPSTLLHHPYLTLPRRSECSRWSCPRSDDFPRGSTLCWTACQGKWPNSGMCPMVESRLHA